jgi:hypothetical protein
MLFFDVDHKFGSEATDSHGDDVGVGDLSLDAAE